MSETGVRPKIGWILALGGMCLIPLGGIVWAAVGTVSITAEDGGDTAEEDAASTEDGETGATGGSAKKKKKKSKKKKAGTTTSRTGKKATHEAAGCCEALRAAGREAEIADRPTYLAAASACEAAPTAARARTQVKSITGGSKVELPAECEE